MNRWVVVLTCCCSALVSGEELTLLPSGGWTAELREDLQLGLAALPPRIRAAAASLEVELHDEPTPLGLGDATHPTFTHGFTRLHLYAYREADDPRAASRLARLSADQRQRLWRRRAIVNAAITRWDERLHWSARAGWKALAGWEGERPLLVYPWAFSRRRGMESASLDLITFAEELIIPAESLSPDAVPVDDRLRCREPSKARFLDERLAAVDPSWKPARDCPAFESWADVQHLPKFEVLFATPSSSSAQALFGHLLLRIAREDDADTGAVEVMQLAALISPFEPLGSYIARGLSGGFRGVFSLTTLADLRQEALGLEQRSLRRIALVLTADQRLRLLERIWELERVGYIDYRFFKANCATMLRFLLTPALGELAPGPTLTPWETPTQVLDGLAGVLGAVQTEESSGAAARRAREWRAALLGAQTLDGEPAARRKAYLALAGDDAWRAKVLLASLRIERFALDEAAAARLKTERSTVLSGWSGPSTDDLVLARQRRFEQETTLRQRAQAELADMLVLDALLRTAPRRAFEPSELAAIEAEREARETFEVVAEAVAALPEEVLTQAREEEAKALRDFEEESGRRAVPEGGHGHAELGAGVLLSGAPVLRLRGAALVEQLGDQRLRGFGARSAWRVIDGSLELTPTREVVHRAGFTLLQVRSLALTGWGWGAGADYVFADRAHEGAASGEVLRVLAGDHRFTNFLMMNVGLRLGARVDQRVEAVMYPRAGLAFRVQLPGSFGNALRFEGAYLPRVSAFAFEHGASGTAQLTWRLGMLGGVAFTARLDLRAEWRALTGPAGMTALGFEFD